MSETRHEAFAELPEMNPGPVFRLGLDGTIELANRAARVLYSIDDLSGKNWKVFCPGLREEQWEQLVAGAQNLQCSAEHQGRVIMYTLAHRPGSSNVFVYGTDITELKRVEAKLAEQSAREREMAQFPEMNPGPVCRLDPNGDILLANLATRTLLGRDSVKGSVRYTRERLHSLAPLDCALEDARSAPPGGQADP